MQADVLDPCSRAEATARVAAARSALRAAEENIKAADADCAQAAYRRRKMLSVKLLVTREELDRAQSMMRRNEARLRSANVAVEVAWFKPVHRCSRSAIRDRSRWKKTSCLRTRYASPPRTRVLFYRWGGEDPLDGIVSVVEPAGFTKISALGVEEQRVPVIPDITSPPQHWLRLGDGYCVEASCIAWRAEDALQISNSALFRQG